MDNKDISQPQPENRYNGLSPSELRGEMERIILSFPDTGTGFVPFSKMDEQKAKHETSMRLARERSTSTERLDTFSRLHDVLAQSSTTKAFQEMVLHDLKAIYDSPFGFSKEDLERTNSYPNRSSKTYENIVLLLGREPSLPEGAFPRTPEEAYELECRYYDVVKYKSDRLKGPDDPDSAFSKLAYRVKAPGKAIGKTIGFGKNESDRIEAKWKKECVIKYGKQLQRISPPTT